VRAKIEMAARMEVSFGCAHDRCAPAVRNPSPDGPPAVVDEPSIRPDEPRSPACAGRVVPP
jgi:hypothetical protein